MSQSCTRSRIVVLPCFRIYYTIRSFLTQRNQHYFNEREIIFTKKTSCSPTYSNWNAFVVFYFVDSKRNFFQTQKHNLLILQTGIICWAATNFCWKSPDGPSFSRPIPTRVSSPCSHRQLSPWTASQISSASRPLSQFPWSKIQNCWETRCWISRRIFTTVAPVGPKIHVLSSRMFVSRPRDFVLNIEGPKALPSNYRQHWKAINIFLYHVDWLYSGHNSRILHDALTD